MALSRLKIWINEILTASDLNAEFDNIINNLNPDNIDDISANVSAMQTVVDPGEVGSESLASNTTGELQRIRNMIKEITGKSQWYETPDRNLDTVGFRNVSTDSTATGGAAEVTDFDFTGITGSTYDVTGAAPHWIMYSALDETKYHVWFNVTDGGYIQSNPAPANSISLQVDVLFADTAGTLATKTTAVIDAVADFGASTSSNVTTVTNARKGAATNAAQGSVSSGTGISVQTAGVTATLDTDVADVDILIIDTSSESVELTGLQNGVSGQVLYLLKTDTTNGLLIKDTGSGTQVIKTHAGDDLLIAPASTGGYLLEYNGTNWYVVNNQLGTEEIKDYAVTASKTSIIGTTQDGSDPGLGGVSISASCGSASNSTTTITDVTNLSCTLTTKGNPVVLTLIAEANTIGSYLAIVDTLGTSRSALGAELYFVNGSTRLCEISYNTGNFDANDIMYLDIIGVTHMDIPEAGTHTYKIQARPSSGNSTLTFNRLRLVAREL